MPCARHITLPENTPLRPQGKLPQPSVVNDSLACLWAPAWVVLCYSLSRLPTTPPPQGKGGKGVCVCVCEGVLLSSRMRAYPAVA